MTELTPAPTYAELRQLMRYGCQPRYIVAGMAWHLSESPETPSAGSTGPDRVDTPTRPAPARREASEASQQSRRGSRAI